VNAFSRGPHIQPPGAPWRHTASLPVYQRNEPKVAKQAVGAARRILKEYYRVYSGKVRIFVNPDIAARREAKNAGLIGTRANFWERINEK
jgi:hypothetical protein